MGTQTHIRRLVSTFALVLLSFFQKQSFASSPEELAFELALPASVAQSLRLADSSEESSALRRSAYEQIAKKILGAVPLQRGKLSPFNHPLYDNTFHFYFYHRDDPGRRSPDPPIRISFELDPSEKWIRILTLDVRPSLRGQRLSTGAMSELLSLYPGVLELRTHLLIDTNDIAGKAMSVERAVRETAAYRMRESLGFGELKSVHPMGDSFIVMKGARPTPSAECIIREVRRFTLD